MKRLTLIPLLVVMGGTTARAQELVSMDKLKPAMDAAVVKHEKASIPNATANTVAAKITALTVTTADGTTPWPNTYWLDTELRGYTNCTSTPQSFRQSVSASDHTEVSFTETQHMGVSLSVELSAGFGPVNASVAAGVEASVEHGMTTTTGKERTIEQEWSGTLDPKKGVWVGPLGDRVEYKDANYEATISVTKATYGANLGVKIGEAGLGITRLLPKDYSNSPVIVKAQGKFSAYFPKGELGIGVMDMSDADVTAKCNPPAGYSAQSARSVGKVAAAGGDKVIAAGTLVPATAKIIRHKP